MQSRRLIVARAPLSQRADFEALLTSMDGLPVTIRLLDPPLHEFLPATPEDIQEMATQMSVSVGAVEAIVERLHEQNPMLGHRGCRLGITMPTLYEMQAQAIIEATINATKAGVDAHLKIMIPLISKPEELQLMRGLVQGVIDRCDEGSAPPFCAVLFGPSRESPYG